MVQEISPNLSHFGPCKTLFVLRGRICIFYASSLHDVKLLHCTKSRTFHGHTSISPTVSQTSSLSLLLRRAESAMAHNIKARDSEISVCRIIWHTVKQQYVTCERSLELTGFNFPMGRERPEGVFVESQAVCSCLVCLLHFLQTSLKFADLAPHWIT